MPSAQRASGDDDRALQDRVRARGLAVSARADRHAGDLEEITSAWVHWYNTSRLMHRLDRRPPADAEADYYRNRTGARPLTHARGCDCQCRAA